MGYRLLKWLGDPPRLREDGFTVANWRYENHRVIAIQGLTSRLIEPFDVIGRDQYGRPVKKPNGLKRRYEWHKHLPNFVLEVDEDDARIILMRQPYEFRDVTDIVDPSKVRHDPIIVPSNVPTKREVRT